MLTGYVILSVCLLCLIVCIVCMIRTFNQTHCEHYTPIDNDYANGVNINEVQTDKIMVGEKDLLKDLFYPVGSVYMTTSKSNPKDILGFGVWQLIKNAYLYCGDPNKEDALVCGGNSKVNITLGVSNIPKHNHTVKGDTKESGKHIHDLRTNSGWHLYGRHKVTNSGDRDWNDVGYSAEGERLNCADAGAHTHEIDLVTGEVGSGKAFEFPITPPYVKIFVWKRLADNAKASTLDVASKASVHKITPKKDDVSQISKVEKAVEKATAVSESTTPTNQECRI